MHAQVVRAVSGALGHGHWSIADDHERVGAARDCIMRSLESIRGLAQVSGSITKEVVLVPESRLHYACPFSTPARSANEHLSV